jgi:hypothetical protein
MEMVGAAVVAPTNIDRRRSLTALMRLTEGLRWTHPAS